MADVPQGPSASDLALQFRLQQGASGGGGNSGLQYTGCDILSKPINHGAATWSSTAPAASLKIQGVIPNNSRGFFGGLLAGVFTPPNPLSQEAMTAGILDNPLHVFEVQQATFADIGHNGHGLGGGSFVAQVSGGGAGHHGSDIELA